MPDKPSSVPISRRAMLGGMAALAAGPAVAGVGFGAFLETMRPLAEAQGVRLQTFDTIVAGLEPDASLPRSSGSQPEFDKPLQTYYREAVSASRIAEGRRLAAVHSQHMNCQFSSLRQHSP